MHLSAVDAERQAARTAAPPAAAEPDGPRRGRSHRGGKRRADRDQRRADQVSGADGALVPPPPSLDDATGSTARERVARVAVALGVVGVVLSVLLAVGALLAAVGSDASGGLVGAVSGICDVLVGPLGGLVEFSGRNAESRADLVARGLASMIYLVIGLSLPSLGRRGEK